MGTLSSQYPNSNAVEAALDRANSAAHDVSILNTEMTDVLARLTVLDETKVYVTPQMYGAKADGVTDDTAAFKAALLQNKTVFVPQGTYIVSETLELTNLSPLVGENMTKTIIRFSGENTSAVKFTTDRCIIRDIQLLGNFVIAEVGTDNTNNALNTNGTNYSKVNNLYIKGFNIGIYSIPHGYGAYYKNCEIQSCNIGIESSSEFNAITIDTCIITYCDIGIWLGQGRSQNVLNCDIERNNIGIKKNHMGNCLIDGCYIENHNQYAISIDWGLRVVDSAIITNCSFFSGKNFRSPLIRYHGDNKTVLVVSNNVFSSSTESDQKVYVFEPYSGTQVKPYYKHNWLANGYVEISQYLVLSNDSYLTNAHFLYAGEETNFANIVSNYVKCFRFDFDTTKRITMPDFSALDDSREGIKFFTYSNTANENDYMLIAQSENYAVLGIDKIYPNKLYTVIFNRRVEDRYDELIMLEG